MTDVTQTKNEKINQLINDLKISFKIEFIPFSKSGMKNKSFNYKIDFLVDGNKRFSFPYMMGIAYSPDYHKTFFPSIHLANIDHIFNYQIESGKIKKFNDTKILPDTLSIIEALVHDSDVLNYGSFEEWAKDMGLNSDSIKDNAIYNNCLSQSLSFKAAIGLENLEKLTNFISEIN